MRRLVLLILACATLLPTLAQAYDVLVLQSRRDPSYDEALKGFRAERQGSQRIVVLSDYADVDVVRIVREERPRLVLAMGDAALREARKIRQTPVVALLSLGVESQAASQPNLTGVSMQAPAESYLNIFRAMGAKRVGVIVNPNRNAGYLQSARQEARERGIDLVVAEATTPQQALEKLEQLAHKVNALWMLPESTILSRSTLEGWFRIGQTNSVPVVSFSSAYLGLGAAAVVDVDRYQSGREAGRLANQTLGGNEPPVQPARGVVKGNASLMDRFRIPSSLLNTGG